MAHLDIHLAMMRCSISSFGSCQRTRLAPQNTAALMAEADLVVVRLANAHHNHGSLCLLRKCWRSPHRHHPHRFHSMPALLARVLGMARVEAWHHLSNMRGQAACYETRMATAKEMGLPMATVTVMVPVMGRLPGTC